MDIIGINLVSAHSSPGMNNTNPGIYYQAESGATIGTYFNSERRQSILAGWTFRDGNWVFTVGAVSGYKQARILPVATVGRMFGPLRITLVPNPRGPSALHASVEARF